jgi:hypothetical protein
MTTETTEIGWTNDDAEDMWARTYSRFLVEGDLADKVLARVGQETGQVTIRQTTIPSGYSSYTWWNEIEFTIEVDGEEVWETPEQSESPTGFGNTWANEEEQFGQSNYALFNDWLNEASDD